MIFVLGVCTKLLRAIFFFFNSNVLEDEIEFCDFFFAINLSTKF